MYDIQLGTITFYEACFFIYRLMKTRPPAPGRVKK